MIGLVLEPASPAAVTFRARERLRICNEGGASAAAVTLLDGDNIIGAEPSGEGHGIGLGIPTGTKGVSERHVLLRTSTAHPNRAFLEAFDCVRVRGAKNVSSTIITSGATGHLWVGQTLDLDVSAGNRPSSVYSYTLRLSRGSMEQANRWTGKRPRSPYTCKTATPSSAGGRSSTSGGGSGAKRRLDRVFGDEKGTPSSVATQSPGLGTTAGYCFQSTAVGNCDQDHPVQSVGALAGAPVATPTRRPRGRKRSRDNSRHRPFLPVAVVDISGVADPPPNRGRSALDPVDLCSDGEETVVVVARSDSAAPSSAARARRAVAKSPERTGTTSASPPPQLELSSSDSPVSCAGALVASASLLSADLAVNLADCSVRAVAVNGGITAAAVGRDPGTRLSLSSSTSAVFHPEEELRRASLPFMSLPAPKAISYSEITPQGGAEVLAAEKVSATPRLPGMDTKLIADLKELAKFCPASVSGATEEFIARGIAPPRVLCNLVVAELLKSGCSVRIEFARRQLHAMLSVDANCWHPPTNGPGQAGAWIEAVMLGVTRNDFVACPRPSVATLEAHVTVLDLVLKYVEARRCSDCSPLVAKPAAAAARVDRLMRIFSCVGTRDTAMSTMKRAVSKCAAWAVDVSVGPGRPWQGRGYRPPAADRARPENPARARARLLTARLLAEVVEACGLSASVASALIRDQIYPHRPLAGVVRLKKTEGNSIALGADSSAFGRLDAAALGSLVRALCGQPFCASLAGLLSDELTAAGGDVGGASEEGRLRSLLARVSRRGEGGEVLL